MLSDVTAATLVHIRLSVAAFAVAAAIGLLLGIAAARRRDARLVLIPVANGLRALPPLAVLTFALPFLGVGTAPALCALTIMGIAPVALATDAGLRSVPPELREYARGMGMTAREAFGRVELPLALPTLLAGLQTAAVEIVASATIASFIGAGGLGVGIQAGLSTNDDALLWSSVLAVACLAFAVQAAFGAAMTRAHVRI